MTLAEKRTAIVSVSLVYGRVAAGLGGSNRKLRCVLGFSGVLVRFGSECSPVVLSVAASARLVCTLMVALLPHGSSLSLEGWSSGSSVSSLSRKKLFVVFPASPLGTVDKAQCCSNFMAARNFVLNHTCISFHAHHAPNPFSLSRRERFHSSSTVADLGGGAHPPPWQERNPPKNKPLVRLPTGTTKSSNSSVKVATPDASSAVKSKVTNSPLAGSAAQTMSPPPAQNSSNRDLAKQTENPNPETLATNTQSVPENKDQLGAASKSSEPSSQPAAGLQNPAEFWKGYVKESSVKLLPEQTPYTLDSGETCVTIPNSVVEKNKKAWEYFILGQFYEKPPARGAIHAIVNGIWSRQKCDISVNKMEGNSFLFRVPCPNARRRILAQSFWQIDGQTMFVAKWSPGIQQCKPELDMVPVWLEFTGVLLQFFNKDALKEFAGLVGHPVCLHPATKNLTNIEVAKVYTVIDPRKPLPEFVNARFENGDTRRIGVTSPWLPSLCSYCKKFGHTILRCKAAPPTCTICNSVRHVTAACPRSNHLPKDTAKQKGKAPIKNLLPIVGKQQMVYKQVGVKTSDQPEFVSSSVPKDPPPAASLPPAVIPPPSPIVPVSPRNGTVTVEYDLSKGSLSVDLSTESHLKEQFSSGSSSDTTLSSEADDPDDEDQFIEKIDSLWASWLHHYRLKDENFWSLDENKTTSSTWRSLLSLRGLATRFLRPKLGNGRCISFWYDNWTPLGPLLDRFGESGPRQLSISISVTVSEACNDRGWLLRGARSPLAEELQTYLTIVPLPTLNLMDDTYVWDINGDELQEFSISKTWEAVRNREPEQQWTQSIWFKGHVRRHAFTAWVIYQDRLPTRSRLLKWGMNISPSCCLCDAAVEDITHLFLNCEVSEGIWNLVLHRLGYSFRAFHTWTSFTEWVSLRDTVTSRTLKKIVAQVTITNIWMERNTRLHVGEARSPATIFRLIDRFIKDVILGKRKLKKFQPLMQLWIRYE
ncbi:hypothetical protein Bca4012_004619 [Brassica carinata]